MAEKDLFGAAPPDKDAPPHRDAPLDGPGAGGGERLASDSRPLADRLRPRSLSDILGQTHLLGPEGALTRLCAASRPSSTILWGPPGVGKTTIARLLAGATGLPFIQLSAIFSGVADLRKAFAAARASEGGRGALLFVDEIHRFNRSQQDAFLPHMEDGSITLVGATTENPSFALNAALLSRAQVLTLKPLDEEALALLLARAEAEMAAPAPLDASGRDALLRLADGDGRALLNLIEDVYAAAPPVPLDGEGVRARVSRKAPIYDRDRDGHFNLISALHKSVRGSDPDAALYWFCRMLGGGEDPLYLARRLARMAVEDIGLADPDAPGRVVAAREIYEQLGSPEGELALAQAVVYLALAPKSNAVYTAYKAALRAAKESGSVPPPAHILNAPTTLMKSQGYGAGYAYDHDAPDGFSGQAFFPDGMERRRFYAPQERGFEREMLKRVEYFERLRRQRRADAAGGESKPQADPER